MRRRRFPRRPFGPGPGRRRPPGRRPIPPKLIQAHRLFDQGEYDRAAALYSELAEKARDRGVPQAPSLYLRGADSWLKDGDPDQAELMAKTGLGILAAGNRWRQFKRAGSLAVTRFKAEGQDELAAGIQEWLDKQIPEEIKESPDWQTAAPAASPASVKLPPTCGQCGGPVSPDEVEGLESGSPACSYCGAILA